jgi:hypothetical protein
LEKALCDSVIMAITTTARAGDQIVFAEERLPLPTGKLGTLVGMNHDLVPWLAPPNRSKQRLQSEICGHSGLH